MGRVSGVEQAVVILVINYFIKLLKSLLGHCRSLQSDSSLLVFSELLLPYPMRVRVIYMLHTANYTTLYPEDEYRV